MNNQAELISIGNELLSGRTLNTHGKTLGGALYAIGLNLVRDTTIPDQIPLIQQTVSAALARTPLVFVSGGLGPTPDDITRDALATMLNRSIQLDRPTADLIATRLHARGKTTSKAAERQALVIEGAEVLPNSVGAAPGQYITLPDHRALFILPGPPNEFSAILEEEIIPRLRARYTEARPALVREICSRGMSEAELMTQLEMDHFNAGPVDIGFYPGGGRLVIRLTAHPEDIDHLKQVERHFRTLLCNFLIEEEK